MVDYNYNTRQGMGWSHILNKTDKFSWHKALNEHNTLLLLFVLLFHYFLIEMLSSYHAHFHFLEA